MVVKRIDPELLVALEKMGDFELWKDLPNTRVKLREFAEQEDAHLSIMDHVSFAEHQIAEAGDNPDLRVRVYRPEKA